jgi:regulator of cell morphogenesis and NO signaling
MHISEETLVADIAAALPSSVRVFQRYGIDFCCGGKRPLGVVCEEQGLPFADVAGAIAETQETSSRGPRDWTREPLHAIVDHIVATYHDPLREELPRLETMAARVEQVHGSAAPHLALVRRIVDELSRDLSSHMQKEERVLFPAIRAIDDGSAPRPMRLATPIAVMEQEHDHAGELLADLRRLTDGYEPPEWACQTFRALYHGLAELESQMHLHVHLENNVLFPRALQPAGTSATA